MKSSLVVAALVSLFASSALADSLISCKTATKTPVTVLEYLVKSTASQRLNSPLFFTKDSIVTVLNQADVAQFKSSAVDLFALVDDSSENKVLQLFAVGSKNKFLGAVTEFNSTGGVLKNTAVICTSTAL